jgi:hypothetical protein
LGYCINLFSYGVSVVDAATSYFSAIGNAQASTTSDRQRLYISKAGTIKASYLYLESASGAGTNESWSLYIRVNDTTDSLVQSLSSTSTKRVWSNTSLSISVSAGDYIEMKLVNPTWSTNPSGPNYITGSIYIE